MTKDPKTAIRQARFRAKKKNEGYFQYHFYLTPEEYAEIQGFIAKLRVRTGENSETL